MRRVVAVFFLLISAGFGQTDAGYDRAVKIFQAVEDYRQPLLSKKALDYSPSAVEARYALVRSLRDQLDAIDPSSWPVAQRIDGDHRQGRSGETFVGRRSSRKLAAGPKIANSGSREFANLKMTESQSLWDPLGFHNVPNVKELLPRGSNSTGLE